MALLPKIQDKDVYSFNDAQALINPSNVSSEMGKAISTDLYNRVYQAEKQSNEELINQLKDLDIVRNVIEEVVPDEKERTELYAQYSALQRALEENSSSLNGFSKIITQSFMKKGIGKNGQFTQAQDILMSVGGGIKGELFPVFQGIIDQTSTFLKNRSDRKERVEEGIMKNIGSKPSSNNNTTEEEYSSERKNFSNVTNGENNTSILEHIDMNVDELLSKFKTEDGRIDAFKVESFLSELSEKLGEPLEAEAFGEAMRDILSVELSKLSSEQIQEFKDSMSSERGTILLEKSVSFDGYNNDEKPVIIDTLKEMMATQADLLMKPKREMKDFSALEAQEEYQRDSIKEQQRTATGIEKLCGILTGEQRKSSSNDSNSGGIISNLIDSGKDLLLAKMGLDKFFGKDKASKGGAIKKTPGGLSSKGGGIFKKVGGWLTALGGGALLSGGGSSDVGDVATDVLTDTATDKAIDKVKTPSKPKSSIFSKLKNAFNIVKESKAVNAIKEGGMKLVRFGGDKAVQGARTVAQTIAANPLTSATVGAVIAAGAANKYANEKAKETEEGQKLLEYGDGLLDTSDNFDFEDAGFEYANIGEKGLDAFGNVKDEEKYFESVQEKSKEAWNEANKDTEGFRTIASEYKDKKLAWEVWNRGDYEKKYSESKDSDLSTLQKNFSEDYKDAKFLADSGVYFNRDKMAIVAMNSGGEKTFSIESNPGLKDVTKSVGVNGMGMPLQIESAKNEYSNAKMSVSNADGNKKQFNVSATTGIEGYEKVKHEFGGSTTQTHDEKTVYGDSVLFEDVSELKDAAPMELKELETEKSGFHHNVLSGFMEDVKDYNSNVGWDAYAPYMFQVESAYLEKDEGLRNTLLDKIKKNFLKTYDEKYKAYYEYQPTKEDVTPKSSSIPVLPETESITDIDHDYSNGSFEEPTKEDVTPKYVHSDVGREQMAWEEYGRFSNPVLWGNGIEEQDARRVVTREAWEREGLENGFNSIISQGHGANSGDIYRNKAQLDLISHSANVLNEAGLFYGDADRVRQMEESGQSSMVYPSKYGDITYTIKQLEDGQKVLEKHKSGNKGGISGMLEKRAFKTANDLTDTFTPQSTALTDTSVYKNEDGTWKSDKQILNEGNFTSSQDPSFEVELYKRNEAFRKESGKGWLSLYENELSQLREGSAKTSELTQHPSNTTKNDAYTSQPTRTSVPEKKDNTTTKQETKQQPTVINNFNTTNNNVTQSAPQRSPQLLINPSGSYMGERQPTSR